MSLVSVATDRELYGGGADLLRMRGVALSRMGGISWESLE
jgi:hypothetical protein